MRLEIEELLDQFEELKIKNLKISEPSIGLLGKIKNGYRTIINKIKSSNISKRCMSTALAATMLISLAACSSTNSADTNIDNQTAIVETQLSNFDALLNRSKSETQKAVIGSIKDFLLYFNIDFANQHIEAGKDIKAALTWDEVASLAILYNDFSNQEIKEIFNGANIDENDMLNSYKTGFLILMGAHVLEDSNYPVKIDMLLQSQEAKDFYNKYHELFLAAKSSKGEEQLNYVQKFYSQLRTDFPISLESRGTSGIAHADPRASIKDYYYSVLPMLSAAEILFQNLDIDYTLNDQEIALINELGACNLAGSKFSKVAIIAALDKNSEYADYEALKKELVDVLVSNDSYVIDDAHRELTQLDEFFEKIKDALMISGGYWNFTTNTYTVVTREEIESREEAIRRAGLDKVEEAEKDADRLLDEENKKAKEEAEKEAEKEAERLQEEADKETEKNKDKVEESDKDLQDKIDEANKQDDPVREEDLGHGANFDRGHSDGNGTLNDSVTDITTDPSGAQDSNDPLPDPNETGAAFDASYSSSRSYVANDASVTYTSESSSASVADGYQYIESANQSIYEYEEPYAARTLTNEELATAIVEAMASMDNSSNTKVYTHKM